MDAYTLNNGNGKIMIYADDNQLSSEYEIVKGEIRFGRIYIMGYVTEMDYVNKKLKKYYPNGKLLFEGECLNKESYGCGKEYYETGELKYEGDYLYNNIWNGRQYDKKGNLINELNISKGKVKIYIDTKLEFEGEYLNGEKHGRGKEYDNDGKIKFEGEYLNGKKKWKRKKI